MTEKITWIVYVALAPLLAYQIRYLSIHMDNSTLWFYRFLLGGSCLFVYLCLYRRKELKGLLSSRNNLIILSLYSLMLIIGSFAMTEGVKRTNATTCNLFGVLNLPVTAVLAYIIHREEGDLLRDKIFIWGVIVIGLGAMGFSASESGSHTEARVFMVGVAFLLVKLFINCGSLLLIRRLLLNHDSLAVTGCSAMIACVILMSPVLFFGDITAPFHLSTPITSILILSGVYGIIVGFVLNLVILKKSGPTTINLLGIMVPASSAVIGLLLMNETLTLSQLLFGGVLTAGCVLCLTRKNELGVTAPVP